MRITNQNQTPAPSPDNSADGASAPRNDAAAPTSPSLLAQTNNLMPSYELLSLSAALQQVPSVRQEVIAETTRRLAAGQLQTPTALVQTARAILGE